MTRTLMKLMLIGAAAPMVTLAQIPPAPPAPLPPIPPLAPMPPIPPVRPKFDYDFHYDYQFELMAPKLHELKLHMDELRLHEVYKEMNHARQVLDQAHLKIQIEPQLRIAMEIAKLDLERVKEQSFEIAKSQLQFPKAFEMQQMQSDFRGERFLEAKPRPAWAREDPADSLYRLARESLNRGEYRRAAQLFSEVTKKYPKSQYALDCAYWEAFSRYRAGTTDDLREALKILNEGRVQFASLRSTESNMDVQGLRARVQGALAARGDANAARQLQSEAAQSSGCDREEISVRAEALSALGQMDLASAMPVVKRVLARRDECTTELRRRALYLIGRQPGSDAIPLMLDVAKNDTDPGIRGEAMSWLSRVGGDQAVPLLEDMLLNATDERTQRSAIAALGQIDTDRARRAVRTIIERNDAPERVRYDAILSMARDRDARGATSAEELAYLRTLYAKLESARLREAVLTAASRAATPESEQFLLGIARNENEAPSLRSAALQRLGRMTTVSFTDIAKLYDVADSRSLREQILRALSQRTEPEAIDKLVEVAKKDTDPNIRRTAISLLARSNNPRALQAIKELLPQ